MLSDTGLNHFYYVRDFTDMRCKHSRVLSIIQSTQKSIGQQGSENGYFLL